MWWPSYGKFEVVVGAILTQNTKWSRVESSLQKLSLKKLLDINALISVDIKELQECIKESGFYKSKSIYLKELSFAIKEEFYSFENFCEKVDRAWLLKQKGVGFETADSILCYACKKDAMVVDAYTMRLLNSFGYDFKKYNEMQKWCEDGLSPHFKKDELFRVYALFHGMIVEFVKLNSKAKEINIKDLN